MGFITTIDRRSGREVYACEIGADGCHRTGCTAHRCPYGWCQRYYVCRACWAKPETKALFSKSGGKHERCRVNSIEFHTQEAEAEALKAAGKFVRVAALSTEDDRVHVIFRGANGIEAGRYMTHKTYDAIPIGKNATIEDYENIAGGSLLEAPTEFYHTRSSSKQVA